MKLNFIIVGAQKAGSTFLHQIIAEHPQVYMPPIEVPYFESPDYENDGFARTEKLFENQNENLKFGIKRPSYLYLDNATNRIKKHYPETKIIISIRNPYKRFLSGYYHNINSGFLGLYKFNKGVSKIINKKLPAKYKRAYEVLAYSLYADGINKYINLFGRENVLILNFDELKQADKSNFVKKIYSFLDIENNYKPKNINTRPQAVVYQLFRLRVLRLRNRYLFTYNADRTRLEVREMNKYERKFVEYINKIDEKWLKKRFHKKPEKIEFPNILCKMLNEDIEKTEKITNLNLSDWKQVEK